MSIVNCDDCDRRIDLDVDECKEIKVNQKHNDYFYDYIWLCLYCYKENNKEEG